MSAVERAVVAQLARDWDAEPLCPCGHALSEHDCLGMGCLFVVEDRDDEHWHPVFCACPRTGGTGRWRALAGAGDVAPQTDAGSDPC